MRQTSSPFPRTILLIAAAWGLAACGASNSEQSKADADPGADAATPYPGEGAAGMVSVDNAGAAQNPVTPPLSGGPAGQTPAYGTPGGAPSAVYSGPAAPVEQPAK